MSPWFRIPEPVNSMPNRISKFASTLKQLGELQVTDMELIDLLNTDIRKLEITRSLRRLGNLRVMEWDFRTVMPAVNRLANQEVDIVDMVRRTARYKVMEWDFRTAMSHEAKPAPIPTRVNQPDMQAVILRLKNFLQYVVVNLIDEPSHARITVKAIEPNILRFKLVLVKRDVAMLIGMEGHTASAIRNILKTAAGIHGVQALLRIKSHEEESEGESRD